MRGGFEGLHYHPFVIVRRTVGCDQQRREGGALGAHGRQFAPYVELLECDGAQRECRSRPEQPPAAPGVGGAGR